MDTLVKYEVEELCKEFLSIENEMYDLLQKADSLAKDGEGKESWEKFKELQITRQNRIKSLALGNNPDDMADEVHDAILCGDDDIAVMPDRYSAIIIDSSYNSIMKYYNTISVVKTPQNTEYLISVPTYSKIKIGTIYQS